MRISREAVSYITRHGVLYSCPIAKLHRGHHVHDRARPVVSSTALALPGDPIAYERHRPEQTPLYALVEEHFPRFLRRLEAEGVSLLHFVKEEFKAYLTCGRLEYG